MKGGYYLQQGGDGIYRSPGEKMASALLVWLSVVFFMACGLPQVRSCAPSKGALVTKGEDTYVCIVVNDQKVAVFVPKADEYSRIAISGSYASNSTWAPISRYNTSSDSATRECLPGTVYDFGNDKSSTMCKYTVVHLESHGKKSLTKAFKVYASEDAKKPTYVYPVLTAVVSVNQGKVAAITWDDGCYFCDGVVQVADGKNPLCQPNMFIGAKETLKPLNEEQLERAQVDGGGKNCLVYGEGSSSFQESNSNNANQEDCSNEGECDLKVFVVWTGTDANGDYFKSAGLRFSRFQQFSVSALYTSGRSLALDTAADVQEGAAVAAKTAARI